MTDAQGSLFDVGEGDRRRDVGMARADGAADPDWVAEAEAAVGSFRQPFYTDDVWEILDAAGVPFPREGRALGPVMLRFYRAGLIEPTGEWDRTKRPGCHRAPMRQWRPTFKALRGMTP